MDAIRAAATPHVAFAIQRLGAQLGPAVFVLPDGRQVSPLHVAPWADDPGAEALPGILRSLRGEWPCVPYGYGTATDADTPARWAEVIAPPEPGEEIHGHASNTDCDGRMRPTARSPSLSPIPPRIRSTTSPAASVPCPDRRRSTSP